MIEWRISATNNTQRVFSNSNNSTGSFLGTASAATTNSSTFATSTAAGTTVWSATTNIWGRTNVTAGGITRKTTLGSGSNTTGTTTSTNLASTHIQANGTNSVNTITATRRVATSTTQTLASYITSTASSTITKTQYTATTTRYASNTDVVRMILGIITRTQESYRVTGSQGTGTRMTSTTITETELSTPWVGTVYKTTGTNQVLWFIDSSSTDYELEDIAFASDHAVSGYEFTAKPFHETIAADGTVTNTSYTATGNVYPQTFGSYTRTTISWTGLDESKTLTVATEGGSYALKSFVYDGNLLPQFTSAYELGINTVTESMVYFPRYGSFQFLDSQAAEPAQQTIGRSLTLAGFIALESTITTCQVPFYTTSTTEIPVRGAWDSEWVLDGATKWGSGGNNGFSFAQRGTTNETYFRRPPQKLERILTWEMQVRGLNVAVIGAYASGSGPDAVIGGYYTCDIGSTLAVHALTAHIGRPYYAGFSVWPRVAREASPVTVNILEDDDYDVGVIEIEYNTITGTIEFESLSGSYTYTSEATSTDTFGSYTYATEITTAFEVGVAGDSRLDDFSYNNRRVGGFHNYGTQLVTINRGAYETYCGTESGRTTHEDSVFTFYDAAASSPVTVYRPLSALSRGTSLATNRIPGGEMHLIWTGIRNFTSSPTGNAIGWQ